MNEKSIKSLLIVATLLLSSMILMPQTMADDSACEFYLSTSSTSLKNGTSFTVTVYVSPQTPAGTQPIDTAGVDISYSSDQLDYTGYSWGNLFSAWPGLDIQTAPAVDETAGTLEDISWGCQDAQENNTGSLITLNFDTIGPGTAYMNITFYEAAYLGPVVPAKVTGNLTFDVREGDPPVFSSISPKNTTGDTPHNHADLSASISDGDSGNTIQWWINTTPYIGSNSGSYTDGSGSQSVSCPINSFPSLAYNTNYSWTIEAYDGYYHTSESYWFVTRPQHLVTPPTGFGATATNKNTIQITWSSQGENSTDVWVEAQQGSYPASRGSGDENWNVTGGFNHDGLNPEEDWYYRAWSYDSTDNVWSTTYSQDMATTPANNPISIASPSPTNGSTNVQYPLSQLSISLDDPEDGINSWSIETMPDIGSNTGSGEGTKTASISPAYGTVYTWYVNATDDEGVTSRAWYTFDTTQSPTVDNSSLTVDDAATLVPGVTETYWNISIEDPEGDAFDWEISCTNGDSSTGNNENNGTKSLYISGLSYGMTYTVTVTVQDTGGTYNYINYDYTFSTEENLPPQAYDPYPANNSAGHPTGSLTWYCQLEDYEGENIQGYNIECSNGGSTGQTMGSNSPGPDNISLSLTSLSIGTYTVWVNATNDWFGSDWHPAGIFYFTVGGGTNDPPTIGIPTPANTSTGNDLILDWYVSISDSESDDVDWTIEVSDGSSETGSAVGGSGNASIALSGLDYATTYTIYVNATDPTGSGTTTSEWFTFDTKDNVAPIIGTPTPADGAVNQSNELDWEVPITDTFSGTTEDDYIYYSIVCSDGSSANGAVEAYGTKTLALSDLSPDTWYTVWVNISDGSLLANETFTFHVANNTPPTIESPTPTDAQSDVSIGINQVSIYINDTDAGDTPEYTIEGSFLTDVDAAGEGLVTAPVAGNLLFDTTYTWYVNATDPAGSGTWSREIYTFTTESFNMPTGTISFTNKTRTAVDISWDTTPYADAYVLCGKMGSEPTGPADGQIYNGTASSFTHIGLTHNTTYYYKVWAWDAGQSTLTENYDAKNTTTQANTEPVILIEPDSGATDVTTVLGGLVNYTDADNDEISLTIYAGPNWTGRHTLKAITDYDGESTFTSPQMPYDSTIHMWINATDGFEWNNRSYTFNTGEKIQSGNITLYYNNSTKTGYNFVALLNETLTTDEIAAILTQYNVSDDFEYFVQWDPTTQTYGDAYYMNMPGAVDLAFEAGDVVLISVKNTTQMDSAGYAPSMAWEDIPLYAGYNWLGRTNQTTTAYTLGSELTTDNVNWTQIIAWNAPNQTWSDAFLPAYGSGSSYNFNIEVGETVLISTTRSGALSMYGW